MLERLDELFDRNADGEFVKQKEVARIRELVKLCPQRLRNHRIVSLELANLVAGTKYRGVYFARFHNGIVEPMLLLLFNNLILFIWGA
jgi:ATP-dependent Clp protease ATP-binding subunit ClpA